MRAARLALFDRLLPELRIEVESASPRSLDPVSLFKAPVEVVWLEIGFGGGEHLIARAKANPTVGIIGCEPFVEGVGKVLSEVDSLGLENVRLYDDDARDLLDILTDRSIVRAFLLYPDPWPKKRHHKRRFVNPGTIRQMARIMRPGGEWLMATDIMDYARWMLSHMDKAEAFEWTAAAAGDWRQAPGDWPGTRYEEKAVQAGRRPVYLRFVRA